MGLDGVELVMAWEESFRIRLEDPEAFKLINTRMAVDLIAAKVGALPKPGPCLSLCAFNRLRAAFCHAGIERNRIRPGELTKRLIKTDPNCWGIKDAVRGETGWTKLPLDGGWTGYVFSQQTIADLVRWVLVNASETLRDPGTPWTHNQVRDVVRAIIIEQTAVEPGFSDEAEFVRDLGID
ncbi:MAG TPA: hypothetical protein DCY13_13395 [Verrucomicrobiales bacterium]|nr:hypothetical protein [Verrucomicrobiales bacterium]